jgi:hypothetical protein
MIDSFLEALRSNEALQQQLRGVFTAAGLADVATAAGLTINAGLIQSSDASRFRLLSRHRQECRDVMHHRL